MAPARVEVVALLALAVACSAAPAGREASLLQTWNKALDGTKQGAGAEETPITRVVNLLKEMQGTLKKEMDEDEELYEKLACWCNNGEYEKSEAIAATEKKIADLETEIERLTATIAELKTTIAETTAELEKDKAELAEATAIRQKQLKAFHGEELDGIQNIENLKAAIIVLGKHHGGAFPQLERMTLLNVKTHSKGQGHIPLDMQLDAFMRKNDYSTGAAGVKQADVATAKFLQESPGSVAHPVQVTKVETTPDGWTSQDKAAVKRALNSMTLFLQAHGREAYNPGYAAQSGEILGIMKQLKEEMEGDLSAAQKEEVARTAGFEELRAAKTDEIAAGEKMLEEKKEELAQAQFDNANAKEDLEREQEQLTEDQKFLSNLQKLCAEGDKNFELRKKSRIEEIQAVSETIEILTADEARDTFNGAYASLIQLSSRHRRVRRIDSKRVQAAKVLRDVATKTHSPQLSVLASSVELDAFTKVKKMIDDMIAMLKVQQEDEVKKKDYCDAEFQENEMETMKAEDLKKDQEVKIEDLTMAIKTLTDEIAAAKTQIADMQMGLQRANEARVKENMDFQKTVADQKATQEILAKALDKLATFYDKESLLQAGKQGHAAKARAGSAHTVAAKAHGKQAPPVPQMEYKPSSGASGVMSMIEKLIYDAKELEADSVKSEAEAQVQYETFVSDTNASVGELQKAVVAKTKLVAETEKAKVETEEALALNMKDLEGLAKLLGTLHQDCDYLLKNFGIRQEGRSAEIEALQQAKQILSGALLQE